MLNGGSAKARSTQPSGPSFRILIESPWMIWLASGIPAASYSLGRMAQIVPARRVIRRPRADRIAFKPLSNARLRPFISAPLCRRRNGVCGPRSYKRPVLTPSMNGPLLRLLAANANRAREALRVLEDYARFVRDDDEMSKRLKELRHEVA